MRSRRYAGDTVWFTTTGNRPLFRQLDLTNSIYELAYDDTLVNPGPLTDRHRQCHGLLLGRPVRRRGRRQHGDLHRRPDDIVAPFLRITGQSGSEITRPAFSPGGTRCTSPAQRGTSGSSSDGITYEVTGHFRT